MALALFAGMVGIFTAARGPVDLERYAVYAVVVVGALGFEYLKRDGGLVRRCLFEQSLIKLHPLAMRQAGAAFVALALFTTLLKDATISRIFLVAYTVGLYLLLLVTSRHLPKLLARYIFSGVREHRTLLVGSVEQLKNLRTWLDDRSYLGLRTVGVLCDEVTPDFVAGLPVLGSSEELERVIVEHRVGLVVVLGLDLILHQHSHINKVCDRHGVRLLIQSDLETRLRHPVVHVHVDGQSFMTVRTEPLENPRNRTVKRLLDIAISLPVVVLVLPVLSLVVWVIHRAQSPGPLFYRQFRGGLQNNQFQIVKFRTMHVGRHDEAKQAARGDARIFPAGRVLRKLSLDELPQFINVLRGDMSIVGPRPHLLEHNSAFAKLLHGYHNRALIRPGITGLAQVRGHRGETPDTESIAARLAADTTYLENWSLSLDLGIIARTFWQMFFPPKSAF